MALRRDKNGNATAEVFVSDAQQRCREREAARIAASNAVEVGNRRRRAARSPAQQIARLDTMLGKGVGAAKERARLNKQLSIAGV